MKWDQAVDMATMLRSRPPGLAHVEVIAIGRFIPTNQLSTTKERWGVSVCIDGDDRPKVLWTEKDLRGLVREPKQAPEELKPTIESMGVPLLF